MYVDQRKNNQFLKLVPYRTQSQMQETHTQSFPPANMNWILQERHIWSALLKGFETSFNVEVLPE